MTWLKLWDECVFGAKNPQQTGAQSRAAKEKHKNKNEKSKKIDADELPTDLDSNLRPQHKIALLCGPPGLGKTTLANVVAKHAGYNIIEMNARFCI